MARVALVTGGTRGIGASISRTLKEAGYRVAANYGGNDEAAQKFKGETGIPVHKFDVSDAAACEAGVKAVEAELGPVDILVNNAGILRPGALASLPLEEWNTLLNVNLTGYLLCAQAFGRGMMERGSGGALVHVASIAASNPQPRSGAYSPSKAAVSMLSRQLALEWGPSGVRSNVVSPGLIRTPMSESFYATPGIKERREAMLPSRRIGTPTDIADAVLFLASPRASYVNGAEILVDGGLGTVLMEQTPRPGF